LHPRYLDRIGLIALWREALLAQKVLKGKTRGYVNHPQLYRFKQNPDSIGAIGEFLRHIQEEAGERGYRFNRTKISSLKRVSKIPVTRGQLKYEFELLSGRMRERDPTRYSSLMKLDQVEPHPLFDIVEGPVENWEKLKTGNGGG
jgi:hypothetical protein